MGIRVTRRGTTNRNARGGSTDRRRRREWLVATFGDGVTVACTFCPAVLTVDTVSADRITPGCDGGTYRRDNIRPSCVPCNSSTGGKLGAQRLATRRVSSAFGEKCDSVTIYPSTTEHPEPEENEMTKSTKLTVPQTKALLQAASVNVAELAEFRSVTIEKLNALGFLSGTRGEHVITAAGLRWVSAFDPEAPISGAHQPFAVGDVVGFAVAPAGPMIVSEVIGYMVYTDNGMGGFASAFVATDDDPEHLKVCQHGKHSDHCTTCHPVKVTATQKLARLQAESAKSAPCCSLWSRGIDCMCADAAELGVDTEELVDDVEETEPVEFRIQNSRTGTTYRVLGTGPAANAPHLTVVWVQRVGERGATPWNPAEMMSRHWPIVAVDRDGNQQPRTEDFVIVGEVSTDRAAAVADLKAVLERQGLDPEQVAEELDRLVSNPEARKHFEPVTYRMVDRVLGNTLTVLGSSALGIFYRYDGDGAHVRTMLASQLHQSGDRYQALCAHDYTQHDSCPGCDAAEELPAVTIPLTPEAREFLATRSVRSLTLAEYLTKTGTAMLRSDARAARC
jgi:hypothetical protein